jgi:hypothetical protein
MLTPLAKPSSQLGHRTIMRCTFAQLGYIRTCRSASIRESMGRLASIGNPDQWAATGADFPAGGFVR